MQAERESMRPADTGVMAILVLYQRSLAQAESWPALARALRTPRSDAGGEFSLRHVLVYDNSAAPLPVDDLAALGSECTYVHDAGNGGTAAAYARGARLSAALGIEWLLLLDHDTALPADLLTRASAALANAGPRVPAALLPWVMHGATVVSPARITRFGSIRPLDQRASLRSAWRLTGIASGSFVRRSAFDACGPLPEGLWLDYVDHWIFANLSRRSEPVALIDCRIQHDLSVRNAHQLSDARLRSILKAESGFVRSLPRLARLMHPWRLLARAARMAGRRRDHALTILRHALGVRAEND